MKLKTIINLLKTHKKKIIETLVASFLFSIVYATALLIFGYNIPNFFKIWLVVLMFKLAIKYLLIC